MCVCHWLQDMSAEQLRDAITAEVLHYSHSKLQMTRGPYVLRPVCSAENSVSAEQSHVKFKQSTTSTVISTFSQSGSSAATGTDDAVNGFGLADVTTEGPGISTAEVHVDGNSVEMPSASACQQSEPDDVTMLRARSNADSDVKSKDEICQRETCGESINRTDTSAVKDNCTDITAAGNGTQSNTNSLVVDMDPSLAADAKARIKAALLNPGRQRQRRGECHASNLS